MWADPAREDVLRAVQLAPNDLERELGDLPGLLADGATVTEGYYTDNRVSAKLSSLGERDPYAWVRLVHECPGYGWREELGTFVVAEEDVTWEAGGAKHDYDLRSILWAISSDTQPGHFSIGTGATTSQVFDRICGIVGKQGVRLAGCGEHRYGQPVVYDVGSSYLKDLFDVADTASCRLGVDGHGRITLGPYVAPSRRDPDWVLDMADPSCPVIDSGTKEEDTTGQATSRVVVTYKGKDVELSAGADVATSSPFSPARRGYTIAESKDLTDMSPETQDQAQREAEAALAANTSDKSRKRTCRCLYFPVHAGDVVEWRQDGATVRYLAQEVERDISDWTVSLTLKEV